MTVDAGVPLIVGGLLVGGGGSRFDDEVDLELPPQATKRLAVRINATQRQPWRQDAQILVIMSHKSSTHSHIDG